MGLYDNYKLTNSTAVQQFAGSLAPELKAAKDQLDTRYEKSQEYLINLPEVLQQAPINPQDQDNWNRINNEAQTKIAEWSNKPDLENATVDLYRYSKQVGNHLKALADQKKLRDDYQTSVDKREDLDPDAKAYFKETADKAYTGLQYDQTGRPINTYSGKTPAKYIDRPEKIRKTLARITGDTNTTIEGYDTDNHRYTVKTGNTTKTITEKQVLDAMNSAKVLDLEWQASDAQEHDVKLYGQTKDLTEKAAAEFIANNPNDLEVQQMQNLMTTKGIPADVAYKQIKSDRIKTNIENAEQQYARSKMETSTSTNTDTGLGPRGTLELQDEFAKLREARAAIEKQKEAQATGASMPWIRGGDMIPTVDENQSLGDVENTLTTNGNRATAIEAELESVADRKVGVTDPRVLRSLSEQEKTLRTEKDAISFASKDYADRIGFVRQQAAKLLDKDLFKLKEQERTRILTALGNTSNAEDIADGIVEGRFKMKTNTATSPTTMVTVDSGTDYTVVDASGKTIKLDYKNPKIREALNFKNPISQDLIAINGKAFEIWKKANKDYSQMVPGFMPSPDKEGKIFKEGLESTINSRGSNLKLKVPGKFEDVSSSDIPKDATWSVIDVAPSGKTNGTKVRVREMIDNKPTGNIYDAYMPLNTYDHLIQLYGSDPANGDIKTMVNAFRPGSGYRRITTAPNNSTLMKGNDGSQFIIQDGMYQIIDAKGDLIKRTVTDAKGNKTLKTFQTTDAYEAGEWLEALDK